MVESSPLLMAVRYRPMLSLFTARRTAQALFHTRKMSFITPFLLSPRQVTDLKKSSTPVTVLDSTWFMPNSPRNAKAEYLSKRIPGSQFLDLDEVASSHDLGLKHMMPDSKTFALACGMLRSSFTCSH
jgi:thiosulfate/3-mercaptopyruvate sulfurtransferase